MLVENIKIRWSYQGNKTECIIATLENEPIATSSVNKFVSDAPNKRLARKISFTRAMATVTQSASIPKDIRKVIWDRFREGINQPVTQR